MKSLFILSLISFMVAVTANLTEIFQWQELSFDWPSEEARQKAIQSGEYVVENNIPYCLDRWKNKLFIAVPRLSPGVVSSLNYVDVKSNDKSPKLIPYPNWKANYIPKKNCQGDICRLIDNSSITSALSLKVDNCDRLWVINKEVIKAKTLWDDGIVNFDIVIFDLKIDKLIRRFPIPMYPVHYFSYTNIIVDSDHWNCSNSYAYIASISSDSVIVYSFLNNESYIVTDDSFTFNEIKTEFDEQGNIVSSSSWEAGISGMAIVPKKCDNSKDVYFHVLSSTKEFKVSNRVFQNKISPYRKIKYVGDRGINHISKAEAYDMKTGVMFYIQLMENAVICWNVKKRYIDRNRGVINFTSKMFNDLLFEDLKIDSGSNIWVLGHKDDPFDDYVSEGKYYILTGSSTELIRGTTCQM